MKYWVLPEIENHIAAGEMQVYFNAVVERIEPQHVVIRSLNSGRVLPALAVFALTGYQPDFTFLVRQGIQLDPATQRPAVNPDTLETNVPGLYVAGVIVGGQQTSEIFIENGRFHGKQIVASFK